MTNSHFVCAAPALTYPSANVLPDELRQDGGEILSTDPARFGIQAVETVYAATRYRWPASADRFIQADEFTAGLENFYAAIASKACPGTALIELRRATIARNVVYCTNGIERRTLYESFRPSDRNAIELVPDAELDAANRRAYANSAWNCFYLGSAGSSNYGHWLVDDLPRLKAAASLLHDGGKPLRIIIPGFGTAVDQVRIDSIRLLLHAQVHVDLMHPYAAQYFPHVYYATPVSEHPVAKAPVAMDYAAREVLAELYAGSQVRNDGRAERIFVRRRPEDGRALLNEAELLPHLVARGFALVDTHGMSFEAQVRTFAQASVVVGTMGAAMANTLFCRPQTDIVYLAPHGWIEPFYLDLAVVRGHGYRVLYGALRQSDQAASAADFTIDVDHLLAALA